MHKILQQADYDFKRIQYNTVVSACMKMLNTLESAKLDDGAASNAVIAEGLSIFLRMLNPVAPHITHVLWQELGFARGAMATSSTCRGRRSTRPRWSSPRSR